MAMNPRAHNSNGNENATCQTGVYASQLLLLLKTSVKILACFNGSRTNPRDTASWFPFADKQGGDLKFCKTELGEHLPCHEAAALGARGAGSAFQQSPGFGQMCMVPGGCHLVTSARAGDEGIGSRWEVVLSPELVEACYRFWDFQNAGQLFIYLFISPPKAPAFVSVITVKRCVKTVVVSLPSRFVVVLAVGEIMKFSRKSELKYRSLKFSLAPLSPAFPETNPCKRVSTHGFGFSLLSFLCSSLACQALEVLGKKSGMDQLFNQSARVSGAIALYYWPRDVFWCPKAW